LRLDVQRIVLAEAGLSLFRGDSGTLVLPTDDARTLNVLPSGSVVLKAPFATCTRPARVFCRAQPRPVITVLYGGVVSADTQGEM
jgi:hypothetical protein